MERLLVLWLWRRRDFRGGKALGSFLAGLDRGQGWRQGLLMGLAPHLFAHRPEGSQGAAPGAVIHAPVERDEVEEFMRVLGESGPDTDPDALHSQLAGAEVEGAA